MESRNIDLPNLCKDVYKIHKLQGYAISQFDSDFSALKKQQAKTPGSAEEMENEFKAVISACENLYQSGIKIKAGITKLEQNISKEKDENNITESELLNQLSSQFSQKPIINLETYLANLDQLIQEVSKSISTYQKRSTIKSENDLNTPLMELGVTLGSIKDWLSSLKSLRDSLKGLESPGLVVLAKLLDESKQPDFHSYFTLWLNLISGFGYMFNYYLIGLTGKDYMLALKMPESYPAILVICTPICAIVFCIVMSFWTNVCFKNPLLFTIFAALLGNLIYASALDMNSPLLILLGIFCVGVGGSRVINLRYIADTVSVKLRTRYFALYFCAGSLGMALGYFVRLGLNNIDFKVLGLTVNSLTAPAYISAMFWFIYLVLVMFIFNDPEKRLYHYTTKAESTYAVIPAEEDTKSYYATLLCFWTILWSKFVHEAFIAATPIIAPMLFGWISDRVSQYLCLASFIVLSVHFLIALTSVCIKDRIYVLIGQILTLTGAFALIDWGRLSEYEYIIGSLILFFATNMSDSVSVSLLSKKLPKNCALGFFNTGFIATIGIDLGRLFGNLAVSLAGSTSKQDIENGVNVPFAIISAVTTLLVTISWYKLNYRLIQANQTK